MFWFRPSYAKVKVWNNVWFRPSFGKVEFKNMFRHRYRACITSEMLDLTQDKRVLRLELLF